MALCALRSSIRVGAFCQHQLWRGGEETKVDWMKSRYVCFRGKQDKTKTQLSDIKAPAGWGGEEDERSRVGEERLANEALQPDPGGCSSSSSGDEEEVWKTTVLLEECQQRGGEMMTQRHNEPPFI